MLLSINPISLRVLMFPVFFNSNYILNSLWLILLLFGFLKSVLYSFCLLVSLLNFLLWLVLISLHWGWRIDFAWFQNFSLSWSLIYSLIYCVFWRLFYIHIRRMWKMLNSEKINRRTVESSLDIWRFNYFIVLNCFLFPWWSL